MADRGAGCAERASAGSGGSDGVTLEEMSGFQARLGALHAGNDVRVARSRRRLQGLRDAALVAFLGSGRCRLVRRDA